MQIPVWNEKSEWLDSWYAPQSLDMDIGDLIPPFAPEVYEYYTLLSVDQIPDMLSRINATAIHQGVTIRVGGEEVTSSKYSRPLPLRVGETRVYLKVSG